jgi:uncharacterized protein YjiS (DUF1127 family)
MSRLTDLNQALRRQPSRTLWIPELATPGGALGQCLARNDAARESGQTPATAVRRTLSLQVLLDALVQPLMRAIKRRRTAQALRQLDAHLLADIGVARDQIDHVVAKLVKPKAKAAPTRVPPRFRPLAALRRGWRRQAAIAALQRLPDRVLTDIGIERGRIPEAVDTLLAKGERTPDVKPEPVVTPLPAVPVQPAAPAHKAAA